MKVTVTQVTGDGTVRRAAIDTTRRADASRWDRLVAQANLGLPPPYQPKPREPVYEVRADEQVVQVAEHDLVGPLRELVTAVFTEGDDLG